MKKSMDVTLKIWFRTMIISHPGEIKDATVATGLRTIAYSSDSGKKPAASLFYQGDL